MCAARDIATDEDAINAISLLIVARLLEVDGFDDHGCQVLARTLASVIRSVDWSDYFDEESSTRYRRIAQLIEQVRL